MLRNINSFIPVLVIDEDGVISDPKTEVLVHLPAVLCKGDTITLQAHDREERSDAVVTDIAYYTRESSPTPLQAYIQVFVSYTRTRRQVEAQG
ncbi:MAG: hypothetical protein JO202_07120 [Ktedonobacteraceae bacterium]|nr:hypothetical protein [Ktedonobacteraceae bacterium]